MTKCKRPTHKRCRQCKEWFNLSKRARLTQKFCCVSCASIYRTSDPKWRKAHSKKMKAQTDPEVMRRMSRKAWDNPETRAYLSEKTRQRTNSKKHLAHMQEHNKKLWADPEFRAAQIVAKKQRLTELWTDPAFREKMSVVATEGNKKRWADPNFKRKTSFHMRLTLAQPLQKKRLSRQAKETMSKPENRERVSQRVKQQWQDPEFRAFMSEVNRETVTNSWREQADQGGTGSRTPRPDG